jgi:hypothetical protein
MAAFREHILFSSILGVGYGFLLGRLGFEWSHAGLAGLLCSVSGMLPDLDSDTGRPVQELFGLTAAVVPLLLFQRSQHAGLTSEGTILAMAAVYLTIRFGAAWLFRNLTVHRGMFHSLPAAVIAGEVVYLLDDGARTLGALVLAGGVCLGFISHLILDEIYSVDARGLSIRLKSSAGSALKLFSPSIPATVFAWTLLGLLTYLVGIREGYCRPIHLPLQVSAFRKPRGSLLDDWNCRLTSFRNDCRTGGG